MCEVGAKVKEESSPLQRRALEEGCPFYSECKGFYKKNQRGQGI